MTNENPLVSVIVITYNSSEYVLETLESAKAQTYQNIELIISDDASTDNTVEICKKWLVENKNRFIRTQLITSENNTGIPANCNRGLFAATGEWIKFIAGDDILTTKCIELNVDFALMNSLAKVIHSKVKTFNNTVDDNFVFNEPLNIENNYFNSTKITAKDQFEILLRSNPIWTPTVFIKKEVFNKGIQYNEKFNFWEDRPLWLTITMYGIKIYFMPYITVYYRLHNDSISKPHLNFSYSRSQLDYYKGLRFYYIKYFPLSERLFRLCLIYSAFIIEKIFKNRKSIITKSIIFITNAILGPIILRYDKKYFVKK